MKATGLLVMKVKPKAEKVTASRSLVRFHTVAGIEAREKGRDCITDCRAAAEDSKTDTDVLPELILTFTSLLYTNSSK